MGVHRQALLEKQLCQLVDMTSTAVRCTGGMLVTAVLLLLVREGTAVEPLDQALSHAVQDPSAVRHIRETKKKQIRRMKKRGSKKKISNKRKANQIKNKNKNKIKKKAENFKEKIRTWERNLKERKRKEIMVRKETKRI